MAVQRYISTSFWDDEWIQSLDPSEKLLYLYLMTNPLTNIAGVYKIANRRICFDTGFNSDTVGHIMAKFETAGKAFRNGEYVAIPSWPKHQKWETKDKIRKGIEATLLELPIPVLIFLSNISYTFNLKPIYDKLSITYDMLSIEYVYQPIYSDINLDTNTDTNSKTDTNSEEKPEPHKIIIPDDFPYAKGFRPNADNISTRIETSRAMWNSLAPGIGPPCRLLAITFKPEDTTDCLRVMTAYTDELIAEAMTNYSMILQSSEHEIKSPYQSFVGFIRGGVEKFVSDANPWELFKKRLSFADQEEANTKRVLAEVFAKAEGDEN